MNHQDARYIPQRRLSDKTHRRWQDRFPLWRLALAAVVMAVVGFVFFQLICRYA
jgi:type VI protein secretion system component VasF